MEEDDRDDDDSDDDDMVSDEHAADILIYFHVPFHVPVSTFWDKYIKTLTLLFLKILLVYYYNYLLWISILITNDTKLIYPHKLYPVYEFSCFHTFKKSNLKEVWGN